MLIRRIIEMKSDCQLLVKEVSYRLVVIVRSHIFRYINKSANAIHNRQVPCTPAIEGLNREVVFVRLLLVLLLSSCHESTWLYVKILKLSTTSSLILMTPS